MSYRPAEIIIAILNGHAKFRSFDRAPFLSAETETPESARLLTSNYAQSNYETRAQGVCSDYNFKIFF